MPILNLAIGQSKYTINCENGEEDKVLNLAKKINERVNNLSLAMRGADEKTVLMLCALTVEEELSDLRNNQGMFKESKIESKTQEVDEKRISQEEIDSAIEDQLASHIENTTDYILKLTKRIGNI
jgi:cell division protein ZapA